MNKLKIWFSVMSAFVVIAVCLVLFEWIHPSTGPDPAPVYSDTVSNGVFDALDHVHHFNSLDYHFYSTRSARVPITLSDWTLKIGDTSHLVFTLQPPKSYPASSTGTTPRYWDATDNRGDSCVIEMTNFPDSTEMIFIYWPDKALIFHLPAESVHQLQLNATDLLKSKQPSHEKI